MNRIIILTILSLLALALPAKLIAAPKEADGKDDKNKAKHVDALTVAVLDFDASTVGNADLGKQVAEALMATLSGEDGLTLVDRTSISKTLAEAELNLTGIVNPDQATKIGKLVGAKIIVTGKIFPLDKTIFFTAKLIGTETSLVEGVLVQGDKDGNLAELTMKLADRVKTRLQQAGPKLVAQDRTEDPLPDLKKSLAGRKLPALAIHVQENHVSVAAAPRIDPAVETELRIILKDAGFTIVDGDDTELADAGVTLIVSGEAFSEFAARIGALVNCVARVEIKIADRKTGEVFFSDRVTTRAVDLAENIAGKTALEKAGHTLGIHILRHFDKTLSHDKAPGEKKDKPKKTEK